MYSSFCKNTYCTKNRKDLKNYEYYSTKTNESKEN